MLFNTLIFVSFFVRSPSLDTRAAIRQWNNSSSIWTKRKHSAASSFCSIWMTRICSSPATLLRSSKRNSTIWWIASVSRWQKRAPNHTHTHTLIFTHHTQTTVQHISLLRSALTHPSNTHHLLLLVLKSFSPTTTATGANPPQWPPANRPESRMPTKSECSTRRRAFGAPARCSWHWSRTTSTRTRTPTWSCPRNCPNSTTACPTRPTATQSARQSEKPATFCAASTARRWRSCSKTTGPRTRRRTSRATPAPRRPSPPYLSATFAASADFRPATRARCAERGIAAFGAWACTRIRAAWNGRREKWHGKH